MYSCHRRRELSRKELTIASEIVCRHSSHILIDGTGPSSRGNLTLTLLELLKGSSVLGEMKYKKLVDEINVKMKKLVPIPAWR
jgi:hypothetical protein